MSASNTPPTAQPSRTSRSNYTKGPAALGPVLALVLVPAAFLLLGWGIVKTYNGLAWMLAETHAGVGWFGWLLLLPLAAWFIYEVWIRTNDGNQPASEGIKPKRRGMVPCLATVGLVIAGNGCLNIAASRVENFYQERKPHTLAIYQNHDLAKLSGQCIRLAMLRHADRMSKGSERDALEDLANDAPDAWLKLVTAEDPGITALSNAKLTEFIHKPEAPALHKGKWLALLQDWRTAANATALGDPALNAAAETIAADFGITLREALKADFEKGGKAWAAMQLDIAQQLLNRTPVSMSIGNSEISAALVEVKGLLADDAMGLPALRRTLMDARQAQDNHAREVVARFDRIESSLLQIQDGVNAVRDGVVSIKDDTSAIRHGVQETSKDIKDFKTLVAGLRLSPADSKSGSAEAISAADAQAIERDYREYLSAGLHGSSLPYIQSRAPLRYRAWRRGAEAGDSMAQVLVGLSLYFGTGVASNKSESLTWFERAADQGSPRGLFLLGVMHRDGEGGAPKSPTNAARLFDAAAELGDRGAISQVGFEYRRGLSGRPMDKKLAQEWYNRAIDKGDTWSMCHVADMHSGVELGKDADPLLAERLYRRAAEAGNQVAKGVLAGRAVGAAFEVYVKADATAKQKEAALLDAQASLTALDALDAKALVNLLADTKLRPALEVLKAADAGDPMRMVHQKVVDLLIARFKASDLVDREAMLNDFANVTADTVVRWSSAGAHQNVVDVWKNCLAGIDVAPLTDGERNELVRLLAASISSLYAVGYRDDATKLADETYQMTEAILKDRPWDWYVRQSSLGIGWNAGASLIEQGEPEKAQSYLRKSWQIAFWMDGRDDLLQKYPTLPIKGGVPPEATPEDREYFERFAAKTTPTDGKAVTPDDKPQNGGLKRFTVPVDFNGTKYPFYIFVFPGKNGYKQVQDQFIWVKEYRGGVVPVEVEDSFRKLNKIAVENNVSFVDLVVYAMGEAAKKEVEVVAEEPAKKK